jgi:hypothetical protein
MHGGHHAWPEKSAGWTEQGHGGAMAAHSKVALGGGGQGSRYQDGAYPHQDLPNDQTRQWKEVHQCRDVHHSSVRQKGGTYQPRATRRGLIGQQKGTYRHLDAHRSLTGQQSNTYQQRDQSSSSGVQHRETYQHRDLRQGQVGPPTEAHRPREVH